MDQRTECKTNKKKFEEKLGKIFMAVDLAVVSWIRHQRNRPKKKKKTRKKPDKLDLLKIKNF